MAIMTAPFLEQEWERVNALRLRLKDKVKSKLKKRPRKRDISAVTAALIMIISAVFSPMLHNWKDKYRQAFQEFAYSFGTRYPSVTLLLSGFEPMLRPELHILIAVYFVFKFILRYKYGFVIDRRGWGYETYVAAIVHQAGTGLIVAVAAIRAYSKYNTEPYTGGMDEWLEAKWSHPAGMVLERIGVAMQVAEMFTDAVMYSGYPGFGVSFWAHHITTFMGAAGFYIVARAPVGVLLCFGGTMEAGGICLNVHNMFPGPKAFMARTVSYLASRLISTVLMSKLTYIAIFRPHLISWVPLVPLWALLFVNYRWCFQMYQITLHRNKVWTT